jgi:O-glycosyl hydrolase
VDTEKLKKGQAFIVTSNGYPSTITFMEATYVATSSSSNVASGKTHKMNLQLQPDEKLQKVFGFGGAFTDATSFNHQGLSADMQEQFIESYFGATGAGYTMGRVHMGGCDFSRMDYTLANRSGDLELEDFCLRDDQSRDAPCGSDYKIPVIQAAQSAIEQGGEELKLFASVWSAPTWYKDQHFTCATDHTGMNICEPSDELQVTCTKAVLEPKTCEDNKQGQPCPAEAINDEKSNAVPTALLARARAALKSASTSIERAMDEKNPKPEDPRNHADGNCYHIGYLSQEDALQESWALYFSKFIDAYASFGVKMWGLTTQNEPLAATNSWQSMYHNVATQSNFVANHLGPMMRKRHPDVKIMIHDDQTISLPDLADKVLDLPEAAKYVDGVGFHWYMALQSTFQNVPMRPVIDGIKTQVGGGAYVRDTLEKLVSQDPDKFIMMTEACNGYVLGTEWVGPRPGDWGYGYAYSHDVLWQLTNGASSWIDWNLLLDMRGGPNLAGNFVDAPVLVKDADTLIQNPSYFHLAHFSKYVGPGSRQVKLDITCGAKHEAYCQAVAFLRPDGNAVAVITNDKITVGPIATGPATILPLVPHTGRGEGAELSWTLSCGATTVSGTVPWKGIQTVVFPCEAAAVV